LTLDDVDIRLLTVLQGDADRTNVESPDWSGFPPPRRCTASAG
jgi:DNA-binding Lrp family transcriptional regulator